MTVPSDYGLLVIGNRSHSRYVLEHLLEEGWNITAVVWASGDLGSQQAGHESVADLADRFDVRLIETEDINRERVREAIVATNPDLGICVGWTDIIGRETRSIPDDGILGFHFSELPKGRGGSPVNWQIIRGDDSVGVSCFRFVDEVDHGDIYAQTSVPVEERDDVRTVYNKLTVATCDVLDDLLPDVVEGETQGTVQSLEEATYFPQRKPSDGLIDWSKDSQAQYDWIRALTHPYPGAFTFFDTYKITIWRSTITTSSGSGDGIEGEIVNITDGEGIDVRTGTDTIRLERIQVDDSPAVWADNVADRYGLTEGSVLGQPEDFPDWLYTGIRGENGTLSLETNADRGAETTVQAVCCSHARPRRVRIEASLNREQVFNEERTVDEWIAEPITVEPTAPSNTLRITFSSEDESVSDTRYIKLYTS